MTIPRWLIVEDNEVDLEFLLRELEPIGAQFVTAHTAGQARRRLEAGDYQLAFVNLQLPDNVTPGPDLSLVHWIRARWPEMPIVIVSGHSDPKVRMEAAKAGALYFFEKGFKRADNLQIMTMLEHLARAEERGQTAGRRNWRTTTCCAIGIAAGAVVAADFGPLVTKIAGVVCSSANSIGLLFSADAKNLAQHLSRCRG